MQRCYNEGLGKYGGPVQWRMNADRQPRRHFVDTGGSVWDDMSRIRLSPNGNIFLTISFLILCLTAGIRNIVSTMPDLRETLIVEKSIRDSRKVNETCGH
jgi:branched-subunit amino acid permease